MPILAFGNHRPNIATTTHIVPEAQTKGNVTVGGRCCIDLARRYTVGALVEIAPPRSSAGE